MNEHEVHVCADVRQNPYLRCSCGWVSESLYHPGVSLLATVERRHIASVTGGSTPEPAAATAPNAQPFSTNAEDHRIGKADTP